MATLTSYTVPTSTSSGTAQTLAAFKLWAQPIATALAAFGWTQSSDTGQATISALSSVPTTSTPAYQVWTMGDSLQATAPCYLRVAYASASGVPYLQFVVGTGSNGSGTLTNASPAMVFNTATGSYGAYGDCYFSGASNRFQMLLWKCFGYSSSSAPLLSVERSHSATGADTGSFLSVVAMSIGPPTLAPVQYAIYQPGAAIPGLAPGPTNTALATAASYPYGNVLNVPGTTLAVNGTLGVMTARQPGSQGYPLLGVVAAKKGDFVEGALPTVALYGQTHTYLMSNCPYNAATFGVGSGGTTNMVGMRFD